MLQNMLVMALEAAVLEFGKRTSTHWNLLKLFIVTHEKCICYGTGSHISVVLHWNSHSLFVQL